jgi:hypothetical protein
METGIATSIMINLSGSACNTFNNTVNQLRKSRESHKKRNSNALNTKMLTYAVSRLYKIKAKTI